MEWDEAANYVDRNDHKPWLYLKLDEMKQYTLRLVRPGKKEREVNPWDHWELTNLFAALESLLRKVLLNGVKRSAIGRAPRLSSPTVFTVCPVSQHFAGPECPKFPERSFLCVAIKGPLKRWFQLATNPLLSSRDRYNSRAEPLRSELHSI